MNHEIDATGKTIGRTASAAAKALMGKMSSTFERHIAPKHKVTILHAGKTSIPQKKLLEKLYENYSGFPGGLRYTTLSTLLEKKGIKEVYRLAVYGMLPRNKLRPLMMKNLTINE